jgi:YD repeat-containing protein
MLAPFDLGLPLVPSRRKTSSSAALFSAMLTFARRACASPTWTKSPLYSYDQNGNRNMTGWTTGTNNELTADATNTYAYDNEGNLLSQTRQSDGQVTNYTWDCRNCLTQVVVKTSAGVTVTNDVFTYDVENRRIGESINGTQTCSLMTARIPTRPSTAPAL